MIHIWSKYPVTDPDIKRCQELAQKSWARLSWTERPVADEELPRLFRGDGKAIPYVRDVIDTGMGNAPDDEIVVFTNADIQVRSDACLFLASVMQETDACYGFRRDFPKPQVHVIPDEHYSAGHDYSGSDLYAFRAGWWRRQRDVMPDMLLAYEAWDCILRYIMDLSSGGKPTLVKDLIAHEKDGDSWWEKPENRYTLNGQLYNLQLAVAWLANHGIPASRHGIPHDFLTRGRRRR